MGREIRFEPTQTLGLCIAISLYIASQLYMACVRPVNNPLPFAFFYCSSSYWASGQDFITISSTLDDFHPALTASWKLSKVHMDKICEKYV